MPELIDKVPPNNLNAERALLASIMLKPDIANDIFEILTFEDFYLKTHKTIFRAMEELYDQGKPLDIVTLSDYLQNSSKLEEVGGIAFLNELIDFIPTSANAIHYANIVKNKSIARRTIAIATKIIEDSYNLEDPDEILNYAEKELISLSLSQGQSSYLPIDKIINMTFKRLEELVKKKRERELLVSQGKIKDDQGIFITGLPTGFRSLDLRTSGFQKSELIIIAARPSMGKTSFALDISRRLSVHNNIPTGIFSLEMSKDQLAQKLLCAEARVDAQRLRTLSFDSEDVMWKKLTASASKFLSAPLFIDDSAGATVREIRTKARKMKKEHNIEIIFIDYLQLMTGGRGLSNRQQEISEISRSLKLLARELDICVVALSQLSRAVEARNNKRPRLSDLRESGAIEQDADVVLFLYRDDYYSNPDDSDYSDVSETEIIIGKQRNGPTDTVKLWFEKQYSSFAESTGLRE
jgi:replicative DNA helicase